MLTEYELKSIFIKHKIHTSTEQIMSVLTDINRMNLRDIDKNVSDSIERYAIHSLYFENHK